MQTTSPLTVAFSTYARGSRRLLEHRTESDSPELGNGCGDDSAGREVQCELVVVRSDPTEVFHAGEYPLGQVALAAQRFAVGNRRSTTGGRRNHGPRTDRRFELA
jgi:hypothetical protein